MTHISISWPLHLTWQLPAPNFQLCSRSRSSWTMRVGDISEHICHFAIRSWPLTPIQEEVRFSGAWQIRRPRHFLGKGTLADVHVHSIRNYLLNTNVQLGATYKVSQASTAAYSEAYKVAAGFINARPEEVIRIVLEDEECNLQPINLVRRSVLGFRPPNSCTIYPQPSSSSPAMSWSCPS